VAANRLYRERLGVPIGGPSWKSYHPLPRDPQQCPAAQTFRSGKGQRTQETLCTLEGELFPATVYTAPITSSSGEAELVLEIAADMGELRRLQEALRASQQRYRLLFDTVPCYITLQDRSRRIVDANRRFREDFGGRQGAFCYQAYQGRETPCPNCPVDATFADGQLHQAEMTITAGPGKPTSLMVWTAPLRDAAGQIAQVMELATDITPVRQLQDHLSSLGLMLGSISHGIKGVLTGMDAGLYMLASGLARDDGPKVEEGLAVVRRMVERIRSVVLDILTFARERSLNWRSLEVAEFAREVAAVAKPRVEAHGVCFALELGADLGRFEADATMLRSALLNLLENGAEACSEERSGRPHRVVCQVRREGRTIEFQVSDNGCGMHAEVQAKLFTLFFSSKGHAGTGLGLFIAERFIRQHGGSIAVRSRPMEGSTFTVRLPDTLPPEAKNVEAPRSA
jgi:signal transduction histidine kinase